MWGKNNMPKIFCGGRIVGIWQNIQPCMQVLILLISCAILLYIIIASIKCIHFLSINKTKDNKKIIKIVGKELKNIVRINRLKVFFIDNCD